VLCYTISIISTPCSMLCPSLFQAAEVLVSDGQWTWRWKIISICLIDQRAKEYHSIKVYTQTFPAVQWARLCRLNKFKKFANCCRFAIRSFINMIPNCILSVEIDRYGFFGADANTSAVHGLVVDKPIFPEFFKSCFLLYHQRYNVFYVLPFLQKLQKSWFMS